MGGQTTAKGGNLEQEKPVCNHWYCHQFKRPSFPPSVFGSDTAWSRADYHMELVHLEGAAEAKARLNQVG